MCTKKQNWTGLDIYTMYIQVEHTIAYMVHVDEKRCTGRLQNTKMTWISAHMKYSIHMHVHEEKDRETHGLNLEMNRTVWKNFLSLLAAALVLKEFCVTDQEGWNRTCWEHYIQRNKSFFKNNINLRSKCWWIMTEGRLTFPFQQPETPCCKNA